MLDLLSTLRSVDDRRRDFADGLGNARSAEALSPSTRSASDVIGAWLRTHAERAERAPAPQGYQALGMSFATRPTGPIAGTTRQQPGDNIEILDSSGGRTGTPAGGRFPRIGLASQIGEGDSNTARWAAHNATRAVAFFENFGRRGVDGRGGMLTVRINDTTLGDNGNERFLGNAGFYDADEGNHQYLTFGRAAEYTKSDGRTVSQHSMAVAYDLHVHELAHGVLLAETGNAGGNANQAGAVHEGLADIMAAVATQDWSIGEDAYRPTSQVRRMRDISNPRAPDASQHIYATIDEYEQAVRAGTMNEHRASGVISSIAVPIQQSLGWEALGRITYGAMTGGDLGAMSFADAAHALRQSAARLYGHGSREHAVVDAELRRAGL